MTKPSTTKARTRPLRRRFDHDAALAAYVQMGETRSFGRVARQFGVSDTAIRKVAKEGNWDETVADIDRGAREKALARVRRSREQRIGQTLRIVDGALMLAEQQLEAKVVELQLRDLPGLVKLAELLEGEATERLDAVQVQHVLALVLELGTLGLEPAEFIARFDRSVRGILGGGDPPTIEAPT